jgi:uncharacterized protein (DUF1800 family)
MLRSNVFFSPWVYHRRVKSPVDLAVGLVRALESPVSTLHLGRQLAELGQDLYQPPTAAGWPGGAAWINQATAIRRNHLTAALLAEDGLYEGKLNPATVVSKYGRRQSGPAAALLLDLLLPGQVDPAAQQELAAQYPPPAGEAPAGWLRRVATAISAWPEFQLA